MSEAIDLKKVYPKYGDCCANEQQWVSWRAYQQAMQEIRRLDAALARAEHALGFEKAV